MRNRVIAGALGSLLLSGCATWSYQVQPPSVSPAPPVVYVSGVPPIAQRAAQCGPAALTSVLRYWGRDASVEAVSRELLRSRARGVLNVTLAQYARERGLWAEIRTGAGTGELEAWLRRGIPPILMLRVGPRITASYHFIVLTGFNPSDGLWYANVGQAAPHAIPDAQLRRRWEQAGRWLLILSPPERVDWPLRGDQAASLARVLEQAGAFDAAALRYQQALADRPGDAALRFNLANIYLRQQRWGEAKALYEALLRAEPFARHLTNNLAWADLQDGRPEEAIARIEEAFRHGAAPDSDILDTLGAAYCHARQPERGRELLRQALERVPPQDAEARQAIQAHVDACATE